MKQIITSIFAAIAIVFACDAANEINHRRESGAAQEPEVRRFGGIADNIDNQNILEAADFFIYYRFTETVIRDDENVPLIDTLMLTVGRTSSVFFSPSMVEKKRNYWGNYRTMARKATRMGNNSMDRIPLSSIADLRDGAQDAVEQNFGYPVQYYKDRPARTISSVLVYNPADQSSLLKMDQNSEAFQEWELLDGTDTLLGYQCRLAAIRYGGRIYTAWYAPDIPVSDGPWKFCGLPGLILKIEDSESLFLFEAIGIERVESGVITVDKADHISCTPKRFQQAVENARTIIPLSFVRDGAMYHAVDKTAYTFIPMETVE